MTNGNKAEWVAAMVAMKTGGEVPEQMAAIKRGFNDLLPADAIAVFTGTELDLLLNGKPDVPVEDMRACSVYSGGYEEDSEAIGLFWDVMEGLPLIKRQGVVRFATGTHKVYKHIYYIYIQYGFTAHG